jgi:hypothetical protein
MNETTPAKRACVGLLLAPLLALLLLAGCRKDEIRTYEVPRESSGSASVRLLVAMFARDDATWFFKFVGPVEAVRENQEVFTEVFSSVRFPDKGDPPITWKVPEGWRQQQGPPPRYATLRKAGSTPDLAISKLAPNANLLDNVNRWRRQDLGLGPTTEAFLPRYVKKLDVKDQPVTLVDMLGPGPRKGSRPMAAHPLPITYRTPKGWTETGPKLGKMVPVLTSFRIREGERSAEVEVTFLGPQIGPWLANVNRWRGQVGLPDIPEDQLDKQDIRPVKVDGTEGKYIDLTGPGLRSLLVMVKRGERTWFFKMLGPRELVARQKSAFEAFVGSVKFAGGRGAADE